MQHELSFERVLITISIKQESPDHEEHEVNVNGKIFSLRLDKSPSGPVFSFNDEGVTLNRIEQQGLMAEMNDILLDFTSRRIWGTFVPKTRSSERKKFQKK